jgi:DNA-binding SARP family transcriptional activator
MAGSAEEVDDESPACSSMRRENGDVAIRFEILGELRVRDGEEPTPVPSRRQRKLLAILLAARGRVVTVDRLMDLMWDGDVEAGSKSALRFHISKLRSALEPGTPARDSVIETVTTGYRMTVPPEFVDAWNLEQTAQDALGEAGTNPAAATEVLSRIVASRGQLLNDFIYDEFAQAPRRAWDEYALTAAQTCAELLLRSQDPQSVIEMLTPLLAEESGVSLFGDPGSCLGVAGLVHLGDHPGERTDPGQVGEPFGVTESAEDPAGEDRSDAWC